MLVELVYKIAKFIAITHTIIKCLMEDTNKVKKLLGRVIDLT